MLIGLCIRGQERQKLLLAIEIDAYGIEGGPIYLNAMVGFYLNEIISICGCLLIVPIISTYNSKYE